jgi:hypothetical protein
VILSQTGAGFFISINPEDINHEETDCYKYKYAAILLAYQSADGHL